MGEQFEFDNGIPHLIVGGTAAEVIVKALTQLVPIQFIVGSEHVGKDTCTRCGQLENRHGHDGDCPDGKFSFSTSPEFKHGKTKT